MNKKKKRLLLTIGEVLIFIFILVMSFILYNVYQDYKAKKAENEKYEILESYLRVKNYPGLYEKVTYMEYEDSLQKYSEVANAYEYYNYIKNTIDNYNALETSYPEDTENSIESCIMWFYYLQKATTEKTTDLTILNNENYLEDIYKRAIELITDNFDITEDEIKKRCEK